MIFCISNHHWLECFVCHLLVPFWWHSQYVQTLRKKIFGFSTQTFSNLLVVLPVLAILLFMCLHVLPASEHSIFLDMWLSLVFKIITNAPFLITENLLSVNPFSWGLCGVVYFRVTFYFLHAFCNFDWCSPVLSQHRYLTGLPHDIIFSKKSSIFFGSCNLVFVKKLRD